MIVYTCITGGKDKLTDETAGAGEGVRYVAFVDDPALYPTNGAWEVQAIDRTDKILLPYSERVFEGTRHVYRCTGDFMADAYRNLPCGDAISLAMWHRHHPHLLFPDEDVTLWIDGNMAVHTDPSQMILPPIFMHDTQWVAFDHELRDCAYEEAAEHLRHEMDLPSIVEPQMERYRADGFPEHFGLTCCGWLLRRNTRWVTIVNELWWSEIVRGSFRDQFSLPYVRWKTGMHGSVFRNLPANSWGRWFRYDVHNEGHHSVGLVHRLPVNACWPEGSEDWTLEESS